MLIKPTKEINLGYASLQLLRPPLVRIEIHGDILIGEKEAKEITTVIGTLSEGKELPVMILADSEVQFDGLAKAYSASAEGTRFSVAEALVVKNFAQRLLASFYLKFNRPAKPTRIFESESLAKEWLYSMPGSEGG